MPSPTRCLLLSSSLPVVVSTCSWSFEGAPSPYQANNSDNNAPATTLPRAKDILLVINRSLFNGIPAPKLLTVLNHQLYVTFGAVTAFTSYFAQLLTISKFFQPFQLNVPTPDARQQLSWSNSSYRMWSTIVDTNSDFETYCIGAPPHQPIPLNTHQWASTPDLHTTKPTQTTQTLTFILLMKFCQTPSINSSQSQLLFYSFILVFKLATASVSPESNTI